MLSGEMWLQKQRIVFNSEKQLAKFLELDKRIQPDLSNKEINEARFKALSVVVKEGVL